MAEKKSTGSISMVALTIPIALEQFFKILVSSIDTIMLSSYNDAAVAAVGMTSQYMFFINLLFNVVCTGTAIVLSQYIGANKDKKQLNEIAQASTVLIVQFSIMIMALVFFGTKPLLSCYTLEPQVRSFAISYFMIFGGIGAVFIAFNLMQGAILRTYGYTKEILISSVIANIVNVIGNAISLYGFFGLPVFGVAGVAVSSVFSNFVSCVFLAIVIKKKDDVQFNLRYITQVPKMVYALILKVGLPTAGESISYNLAQITIMAMITTLGTAAMSAQVYTQTIVRFVFVLAVAIGSATQIKTGYYVGAKQNDVAYKKLWRYQFVGTLCSMVFIIIINLIKTPIIHLFTRDEVIFGYVHTLLLFSIYIEFGRSLNLISIAALRGAGDVKFPVFYGIFSMWCIMVFGSYILGLKMGLGLVGFWLGIGSDETLRGIVMLFRWKSKRWQTKALV